MLVSLHPPTEKMLLWLPSPSSGGFQDQDEKGAKLRRRARARCINLLLMAVFFVIVLFVLTGQVHFHHPKTTTTTMTRGGSAAAAARRAASILRVQPRNSIYRLSVTDSLGTVQSLEQYAGMVTLVVNTACK